MSVVIKNDIITRTITARDHTYKRDPHRIGVKEISQCLRKSFYERTHPHWNEKMVVGTLVHLGTEKLFGGDKANKPFCHRMAGVVIKGKPDLILDDNLYEFKFTGFKKPTRSFIRQVSYYKVLLSLNGIQIKKTYLVLIAPDSITQLLVVPIPHEKAYKEMMLRAKMLSQALVKNEPPEGEPNRIECNMCPLRYSCPFRWSHDHSPMVKKISTPALH